MSPVNSVAVNFTAQVAVPYVDSGTGSLAQTEDSCRNRESKFSFTLSKTDCEFYQLLLKSVCDDEQPLPEPEFGVQPGSMVQTEDMNPIWISSATAMYMSSLGEEEGNRNLPQQFNSQDSSERDAVEQRVGSFEPNLNHLDHAGLASNGRKHRKPRRTTMEKARSLLDEAGSSIAASIGQKRKDCETRILKEEQEHERKVKKRERDRKYRANLKNQYHRLITIASSFGGIDQMESKINHMNSELHRLQKKEVEYDMFQQEIETDFHRLGLMKLKYGGYLEMESMLDKFKEIETKSHILDQIKSKFGVQETESILDKLMAMEAQVNRLDQIKSLFVGIDDVETEINRLKKIEFNQKELESYQFQASPGSHEQMELDHEYYRQQQMVANFERFEQMKSKFGGTEEMETKLEKFHHMEAKLHRLEQIISMFGGINENGIETAINRLKTIESQHIKHKQKELPFFQESPGSLQVSDECVISLNSHAAVSGPGMQYSDVLVDELIGKLTDENVASNLDHESFKDLLDGERESVGKYTIPRALVSTACDIFKAHGDITAKCKYSGMTSQRIFILCCAAIKEMGEWSLEEVNEKIMRKWGEAIMDAKRSECDVEFALQHLKTIAEGYFGLIARKDRNSLKQRMASLRADEAALRKELEMKSNEIKAIEAKLGDLTSKQCLICQESADKFLGKTVGIF